MEILTSNLYNVYSMAMARFDTRLSDKILRAGVVDSKMLRVLFYRSQIGQSSHVHVRVPGYPVHVHDTYYLFFIHVGIDLRLVETG